MEDNTNNSSDDSSNEKMDPTRELYEKLISEVYKYKHEEREMALDRYRRADEQMDEKETFILMGKNAIAFLKQASDSSDAIASLAKEIKGIVYKDDAPAGVQVNFGDAHKKAIIDGLQELEDKKKKNIPDEDLTDDKGESGSYDKED